jgi:hypothetical protein
MRVTSHTEQLPEHTNDGACACGQQHSHVQVQLTRTGLGIAFVVGGMSLGAMNLITPVIAAIFHVTGSLLVVFNSFRLMRLGEELEPHEAVAEAPLPSDAGAFPQQPQPAQI